MLIFVYYADVIIQDQFQVTLQLFNLTFLDIGPVKAFKLMKDHKNIENILEEVKVMNEK